MYDETKLRKRSVGNIRFIGELYKLRMLTSPIMMRIIGTLLERGDEESLECLCKLLTTIGKILETQCAQQPKAMVRIYLFDVVCVFYMYVYALLNCLAGKLQ